MGNSSRYGAIGLLTAFSLLTTGCIGTLVDVATLPVRAAGKAVDLATTSQSEADENRGRELRKREERLGKLERSYDRSRADCADGKAKACDEARKTYAEIQALLPTIPVAPDR